MKVRTQIQLDSEDYEALKAWARQRGVSISAAVRWLLRESLRPRGRERDQRIAAFLSASGAFSGAAGEGRVSEEHDRYLYGAPEG